MSSSQAAGLGKTEAGEKPASQSGTVSEADVLNAGLPRRNPAEAAIAQSERGKKCDRDVGPGATHKYRCVTEEPRGSTECEGRLRKKGS